MNVRNIGSHFFTARTSRPSNAPHPSRGIQGQASVSLLLGVAVPLAIASPTIMISQCGESQTPDPEPAGEMVYAETLSQPLSMLVWETAQWIDPANLETFHAELDKYGVRTVYLSVNETNLTDPNFETNLINVLSAGDAWGIEMYALGSTTEWVYNPSEAEAWLQTMSQYSFDGYAFDVEQYLLDGWIPEDTCTDDNNNQALNDAYVTLTTTLSEEANGKPTHFFLPAWAHNQGECQNQTSGGEPYGDRVPNTHLEMSYRTSADDIESFARDAITFHLNNGGTENWALGQEVTPQDPADSNVSYADARETIEEVYRDASTLEDDYGQDGMFHFIHYFGDNSLRALPQLTTTFTYPTEGSTVPSGEQLVQLTLSGIPEGAEHEVYVTITTDEAYVQDDYEIATADDPNVTIWANFTAGGFIHAQVYNSLTGQFIESSDPVNFSVSGAAHH